LKKMGVSEWTVDAVDAGVRLDKFLAAPGRAGSRGRAAAALARGKVFLNGEDVGPAASASRLAAGDVVRLWHDRPGSARTALSVWRVGNSRQSSPLRIVFEDDALIVVDKPAGLLAVPLERSAATSVYDELAAYLRTRRRPRPLVVHRIDRDTSGLVVFATRADAQQKLRGDFKRHAPERIYLALVYGRPSPQAGTWRDHLVWDDAALVQKETHRGDPRGKEAICQYRVIETFDGASLLEVRLVTGKRNQIRLQARLRGHTLVGEQRYVYGPAHLRPIAFPRQALHALRLAFAHPLTGKPLRFEAPLPDDMAALIDRLRRPRRR
jgi:23S rRNA pseudouridine1911/1915/1917 synthase